MLHDKLTPLQRRILHVLSRLTPRWTLTGGAALAGVYLGHRATRDLDLFWRSRPALGDAASEAQVLFRTTPTFGQLRVSDGDDVCIVDLVAEPFAPIEPPVQAKIGDAEIAVDSMHEILAAKLTALLGRTELRDLIDVQALMDAGTDLVAALRDAPKKDAGFSVLTLAWVLRSFEVRPLTRALGWSDEMTEGAEAFRHHLIDRLTQIARPE